MAVFISSSISTNDRIEAERRVAPVVSVFALRRSSDVSAGLRSGESLQRIIERMEYPLKKQVLCFCSASYMEERPVFRNAKGQGSN